MQLFSFILEESDILFLYIEKGSSMHFKPGESLIPLFNSDVVNIVHLVWGNTWNDFCTVQGICV